MSNRLVSVVIPTVGKKNYLQPCLDSLLAQTRIPAEIIVIDNSGDPVFAKGIGSVYSQVKLFSGSEKLDFCRSLNKGIGFSSSEFILCLNDDVRLDKRFIELAIAGFEVGEKVGMVSGKVLRSDGKVIDSTGLFLSCFRTAKERGYNKRDNGQYDKKGYIFGVTGAAAFYRRKMLEELKSAGRYFDEDFGYFYEDLDISWRAQRSGWKGYYVPLAVAYHVRGLTVRSNNPGMIKFARAYLSDELHFDLLKNRYLAIIKNEKVTDLILHFPCMVVYDLFSFAYAMIFRPKVLSYFFRKPFPLRAAFKNRYKFRLLML